jgi:nucleotide-binding universal stress UspA family protein
MVTWLAKDTIVVPIDFSEDSFAALATASQLAGDAALLKIVHVLPVLEPADPGVIWHAIDDQSRSRHAQEALQGELRRRGYGPLEVEIRFGDPGHEIAEYASQADAGLVVVASHGKSGLMHMLIGSVAERVVRLAPCPVLVLKMGSHGKPSS